MKLDDKEFARYRDLAKKIKAKKATKAEEEEYAVLDAKKKGPSNDLAWWNAYPILTDAVKNIAFNHIAGTPLTFSLGNGNAIPYRFPGVALIEFQDAIGNSKQNLDGFNAQMRQLYLDMHRKYRGIGAYQRSDIGMAIIAIISFFETVAKFERIYGTLNTYKIQNRNVPYALFECLGIDASVENDLADFRYYLNMIISKAKQLCLPKGLAALEEKVVLVSNIFKDADSARAALFMYDNASYGVYDATTLSTGGCVKFKEFAYAKTGTTPGGVNGFTLADMESVLEEQISALLDDDDIAKICSDLIAAYGPENVVTLIAMPEDYRVEPVHDYERLLQFHNLTIAGAVSSKMPLSVCSTATRGTLHTNHADNVIWQENDIIYDVRVCSDAASVVVEDTGRGFNCVAATSKGEEVPVNRWVFDVWKDQPDATDVICGSRFMSYGAPVESITYSGVTYKVQELTTYGTEIVVSVSLHYIGTNNQWTYQKFGGTLNYVTGNQFLPYTKLGGFDWAPHFFLYGSNARTNGSMIGDVDNVTTIYEGDLDRMHDNCVYSLFRIPSVSYIQ